MKTLSKCLLLGVMLGLASGAGAQQASGGQSGETNWIVQPRNHNNHHQDPRTAPEIDAGFAVAGFALLAGSLAILRSRRRKATE